MYLTKKQTLHLIAIHNINNPLPKTGEILYICSPGGGLTTIQKTDQKSVYGEQVYKVETPIIKDNNG